MGKKIVLLSAPYFDVATKIINPWITKWLKEKLEERGVTVIVFHAGDATKEKIWDALKSIKGRLVFDGVGHGNRNVFTGQNLEHIFESCNYPPELLKDRYFGPVSCLVGKGLLPDMVEKGLGAGVGETEVYWIAHNPRIKDKLKDEVLASFTTSEYTKTILLAEGKTAKESYDEMISAFLKKAEEWDNRDPEVASLLRWDATFRKFFGDPDWRMEEEKQPPPPPPPPPPPEKWVCPWCSAQFDKAEDLKQHIVDQHIPPPYACPWCDEKFMDNLKAKKHILDEHIRLECIICRKRFENPVDLQKHLMEAHGCEYWDWFNRKCTMPVCKNWDKENKKCTLKPCHLREWVRRVLKCPLINEWWED